MLSNLPTQCAEAAEHETVEQDADSVYSAVYILRFDANTGKLQQPQGMPVLLFNCSKRTVQTLQTDMLVY
jgi:hypothetical protein